MNINKTFKIIMILVLCLICMAFFNKAYAISIEKIFSDAQNFLTEGNEVGETISQEALRDTSSFIYKLLLAIGVIVAFVVGVVLGIQFMVASAEDKAKVKESLVAYTISCIVLFGAYGIWTIVVGMAQDVTGEVGKAGGTSITTDECSAGGDHIWVAGYVSSLGSYVASCEKCDKKIRFGMENKCYDGNAHSGLKVTSIDTNGKHLTITCIYCQEKKTINY